MSAAERLTLDFVALGPVQDALRQAAAGTVSPDAREHLAALLGLLEAKAAS